MPCKDPEKRREYARKYNAEHRERIIHLTREWQKARPERKRANDRAYRLRHADKVKAAKRKWNAANKARRNAKNAEFRATFVHDCVAWAKWRMKWRVIYAKRVLRRGEMYSPRFDLRIPDYATKGSVLDVRSAFLAVNQTVEQRAWARELQKERMAGHGRRV